MARAVVSAAAWMHIPSPEQWELGGCKRHLTAAEQDFRRLADRSATYEDAVMRINGARVLDEMDRMEDVARERDDPARPPAPDVPACWRWIREEVEGQAFTGVIRAKVWTAQDLKDWQGNRCAMCGNDGAPELDHDHWTGLIRGFLCRWCNQAADGGDGVYWPTHFGQATKYALLHPAKWVKLKMTYDQACHERNWGQPHPDVRAAMASAEVGGPTNVNGAVT